MSTGERRASLDAVSLLDGARARAHTRNAARHTPAHVSASRSLSRCLLLDVSSRVLSPSLPRRYFLSLSLSVAPVFYLTAHSRRRFRRLDAPERSTMCQPPRAYVCACTLAGNTRLRSAMEYTALSAGRIRYRRRCARVSRDAAGTVRCANGS